MEFKKADGGAGQSVPLVTGTDDLKCLPGGDLINYMIFAQTLDDIRSVDNAPWVSMPVYLERAGELERLRRISIYQARGDTAEAIRLLYMNAEALELWRRMGHDVTIAGSRHRPPQDASLAFGVPFSE